MYIQDDDLSNYVADTLESMSNISMPLVEEHFPHCGIPIRYPLIAKKSDIDMFKAMVKSAQDVMDRHGITALLLCEIRAECMVNIARKQAFEE